MLKSCLTTAINNVLQNRLFTSINVLGLADLPHYGAGETSHKPMIAAVANAIHDATGVRLRRVPFRPERVLEALRTQS